MFFHKNKFLSFSSIPLIMALSATNLYGGKNKETFTARAEVFSLSSDIDYPKLQAHLHYSFKDQNLLRDALHPMLPPRLNANKQQFDRLEWQGDAVLELIVINRLLDLFPTQDRGHLDKLRSSLVENKTLTESFLSNLDLEQYLPFSRKTYEICNVAEALIGAIYKDDARNGMTNATTFVMRLLDEDFINEKIREFSGEKRLSFIPTMSPEQKKAICAVCTPERIDNQRLKYENPKSLLNEVMLKIFDDRPEYLTNLEKAKDGRILFASNVVGAQIGKKIRGLGNTVQESEENAARQALNNLAQTPLYAINNPQNSGINFRYQFSEIIKLLGIVPSVCSSDKISAPFKHQILIDGLVIGEGEGNRKAEAEEKAAEEACDFLVQREKTKQRTRENIRLEELAHKRRAPIMLYKPLPLVALPPIVASQHASLKTTKPLAAPKATPQKKKKVPSAQPPVVKQPKADTCEKNNPPKQKNKKQPPIKKNVSQESPRAQLPGLKPGEKRVQPKRKSLSKSKGSAVTATQKSASGSKKKELN